MRGLILLAAVLGSCAKAPPEATAFRDPARPIYSNAVTAPDLLAGRWRQVADFADPGAAPCAARGLTLTPDRPDRVRLDADLCLAGRPFRFDGPVVATGPGRLRLDAGGQAGPVGEWWVLWVDVDRRTLVIGTPSGRFGMILNRDATLPPDRAAAARDILAWNGYDLTRLRPVAPP